MKWYAKSVINSIFVFVVFLILIKPASPGEPNACPPEQNIQHVLISLLGENYQKLLLQNMDQKQEEIAILGYKLQKALVTGKQESVLHGILQFIQEKRDQRCIEYYALDGADCGCDEYPPQMNCYPAPHIAPPVFSDCQIVKSDNSLPDHVICLADDASVFRIAYVVQKLLIVKDWPPNFSERMQKLDYKNDNLCIKQHKLKMCERACDPQTMTYKKCKAACDREWERIHDSGSYQKEDFDQNEEEDEIDYAKIEECQKMCKQAAPSDDAYYIDSVSIIDYKIRQPGEYVLRVQNVKGLVDEYNQDGDEATFPKEDYREVVLHDPWLKEDLSALKKKAPKKQGVWLADLEELSSKILTDQDYYKTSQTTTKSILSKIFQNNRQYFSTLLMDILLSNQIDIKKLVKPLTKSLARKLIYFVENSLAQKASYQLFNDVLSQENSAQSKNIANLLTGLKVRLGEIPHKWLQEHIAEESENYEVENMDENDQCHYINWDSFKCEVVNKPHLLLCQAMGKNMFDEPSSGGEAWLIGVDDTGTPVMVDCIKSEQIDELVPEEQLQKWVDKVKSGERSKQTGPQR
jgi:hypothetical protein